MSSEDRVPHQESSKKRSQQAFPQTNTTTTRAHKMDQNYPLIHPGPGDNPTIYPPFLSPARRGLPEDRIPKSIAFFFLFRRANPGTDGDRITRTHTVRGRELGEFDRGHEGFEIIREDGDDELETDPVLVVRGVVTGAQLESSSGSSSPSLFQISLMRD